MSLQCRVSSHNKFEANVGTNGCRTRKENTEEVVCRNEASCEKELHEPIKHDAFLIEVVIIWKYQYQQDLDSQCPKQDLSQKEKERDLLMMCYDLILRKLLHLIVVSIKHSMLYLI